jgi:ABC-type uncharacterized transport system permease subunit
MRATARVYWRLLVAGFRRQSAYRLAALGGLVANLTFGLLKVALLFATVRAAGGQPHGYTTASMSTYVWLAEIWVLFTNVTALGGMRFNQILLVFGMADLSFSLADLSFGHLDTLPDFLRAGTLPRSRGCSSGRPGSSSSSSMGPR